MLTSKEVLEKTGISRATLNNYISWGIVPRPDVLPPEPQDGAAPRIGYVPGNIVECIEEIQRLKRDGWSITRIAEHFGGDLAAVPAPTQATQPTPGSAGATAAPPRGALAGLSIGQLDHPAYLVNDSFEVLWLNDAAGAGPWPEFARLPPESVSHGVFRYLLNGTQADSGPRQAVLRFHMGLAKQRGASLADLGRDLQGEQFRALERLFNDAERIDTGLVAQTRVSGGRPGVAPPLSLYAVHFREGILFLYIPGRAAAEEVSLLASDAVADDAGRKRIPALTDVAVLVTDLQHSALLWSELPAEEYFELINQIWLTVDPIFRRHRGTHGKHPGEGMVCYFFPQPDSSYLWNSVLAAWQMREAIRRISKEWQLRKGWTTELFMNTGIDEGLEWLGAFRSGAQGEFVVLGETVHRATRMSDFSRGGALWVTRNLMGKLRPQERARLKYGVHRGNNAGQEVFVPSIFSRVESLPVPAGADGANLAAIARLPITEIVDIADAGITDRSAARNLT